MASTLLPAPAAPAAPTSPAATAPRATPAPSTVAAIPAIPAPSIPAPSATTHADADSHAEADRVAAAAGFVARLVRDVRPLWFSAVMGTGIVAVATAGLPAHLPGRGALADVAWVLATLLLVALLGLVAAQAVRHPALARGHRLDPAAAHGYGAPPMALLTVAAGALVVGRGLVGDEVARAVAVPLWVAGTVLGIVVAVAVPVLTFTRHEVGDASLTGGWLMPVVAPMVSAATGTLLLPLLDGREARLTLLLACAAMAGASLAAAAIMTTLFWARLARHGLPPAALVPTLWIVLGPLGQSATAVAHLAVGTSTVVAPTWEPLLRGVAVLYGVPTIGFALLWAAIAGALTLRTVRAGMPFAPTWWAFTFPVGTCATGVAALAALTGSDALRALAVVTWAALVAAWVLVAARTALVPVARRRATD